MGVHEPHPSLPDDGAGPARVPLAGVVETVALEVLALEKSHSVVQRVERVW